MGDGRLDAYRSAVEGIFGEELVSLTLYGGDSADPPEEKGEVTALIVVRELRRSALAAYHREARRFAKQGIPPPPIFTEKFLVESIDVFPIEFLGMKERRRVLSGSDVLADVRVDTANLRHQVEFELKGKLLSLRRMYLATHGGRDLADLMQRTAGPIVHAARGLLLLAGAPAPLSKGEIVDALESRFGLSLPRTRKSVRARDGKSLAADGEEAILEYMEEVERLCERANRPAEGNAG